MKARTIRKMRPVTAVAVALGCGVAAAALGQEFRIDEFTIDAPIGRATKVSGSRALEVDGVNATTRFVAAARLEDGSAIFEVFPDQGRTHQIRLHAKENGTPIVGDRAYGKKAVVAEGGDPLSTPAGLETHGLCLHAHRLVLVHPRTKERLEIIAPKPAWAVTAR